LKELFQFAAATKGLGFFQLNIETGEVTWEEETAGLMGPRADEEREELSRRLTGGLRNYLFSDRAGELRCIVPIMGSTVEMVFLETDGPTGDTWPGFFSPYSLNRSLETMKRYFFSNISNKLRSLLNSVIIAADVASSHSPEMKTDCGSFLSLMAEDAREVNDLLNRLNEIISYSAANGHPAPESIDLRGLLRVIHANLNHLAEDASIALMLAVPDDLPEARGHFISYILSLFLAIKYALTRTDPMGEIIITAREEDGRWSVEICFAPEEVPAGLALSPEAHGLVPLTVGDWIQGEEIQLIDSLLALHGGGLAVMANGEDLGLLRLTLG
jgi:signal transduction histidine kinase